MKKHPLLSLFLLSWLTSFLLYGFTASRFATGYADSDELLTMSYSWSVAHPSGFPLIVFISGLFMRLVPFLSPAFVGNLSGSLFQSLSLAALSGTAYLLLTFQKLPVKKAILYSFIGCLILGVSGIYWLYGSVLEVVSLTNALIGLTVMCSLYWYAKIKAGQAGLKAFYSVWLLAGLSLSHIHTAILITPGLLILLVSTYKIWRNHPVYRRIYIWFFAFLSFIICFVLPNVLLLFFQNRNAPYSWFFEPNFDGLMRHIFRQDYSGFFPEESTIRPAYITKFTQSLITAQPELWHFLYLYLNPVGLILVVFGLLRLITRFSIINLVIFISWLVSGPIFIGYMGFPTYDSSDLQYQMTVGITYRQFLINYWFSGLLLIYGITFIDKICTSKLTLILLGILFSYGVYAGIPMGNQRHNRLASDYALSMLDQAEEGSVIICSSDIACFSLFYAQAVDRYKPSVTVLTRSSTYVRSFLTRNPQYYGFTYQDNPFYLAYLTASNLANRPVYFTNPTKYYIDYIGLEGNPFYLVPKGYLYQVVAKVPDKLPEIKSALTDRLLSEFASEKDFYRIGLRGYFSSIHSTNGVLLANFGDYLRARTELNTAISLFPSNTEPYQWLNWLAKDPKEILYKPGASQNSGDYFKLYQKDLKAGMQEDAYTNLKKATYLSPFDPSLRTELAKLYQLGGFESEAQVEFGHASKLIRP
jgi:hypothetical protein